MELYVLHDFIIRRRNKRGGVMSAIQKPKKVTRLQKHFITDIIRTLDDDLQNLDIASIERLIIVMLGFEKNWRVFQDYITGELNQ